MRGRGGFSLLETVIAMAVLGLIAAPVGAALVTSVRVNARAGELLQARLAVSSAAERIMAEGVDPAKINPDGSYDGEANITIDPTVAGTDVYTVTIESRNPRISITTKVREKGVGGS